MFFPTNYCDIAAETKQKEQICTDSSLKSGKFLEMFASLALSKVKEGIATFSVTCFLREMQAAHVSRSPVSILYPSPAQVTSHIRPIPKSKVLPFPD